MYKLKKTSNKYQPSANPPILDRVSFTIDHIHQGNKDCPSTLETAEMLVKHKIPFTVFMECRDPKSGGFIDKKLASEIYVLAPHLITLGIHSLSVGKSQFEQHANLKVIQTIIREITDKTPRLLSYHGAKAGPETGITYEKIEFARGIHCDWSAAKKDDKLNTPVMPMNTVERAFEYTRLRNEAGLSSTVFTHTAEMKDGSPKKLVFDTFVNEVVNRRLQAVDYHSAMKQDYYNIRRKAG